MRLVVERGPRWVEVFGVVGVGVAGGFAADEADRAVMGVEDREHDPVAEAVDALATV